MLNAWTMKWLSRVILFGLPLIALYLVGTHMIWYFRDLWETLGFMVCGIVLIIAEFVWRGIPAGRVVATIGIVIWAIPGWLVGYAWAIVNVPHAPSSVPMVMQQITLLLAASLPYILLGLTALSAWATKEHWEWQ